MKAEHIYFPGLIAWRQAFLELLEQEHPTEVCCRGVNTEFGPYYEQKKDETKGRVGVERGTRILPNNRKT